MSDTTKKTTSKSAGFSAEEKAAMKERAKELKQAETREEGERAIREKISEMPEADRILAEGIHAIVTANAPDLMPKTWYGMPSYARDGKVLCFFQAAAKFETRYSTFGFNDIANLDDGDMWPNSFAVVELTDDVAAKITALVKRAVS